MNWYRLIMDSEHNALSRLAPFQRFKIMVVLSVMWTTVFCAGFGLWFLFGELIAAHLLLATAILLTGFTFQQTRRIETYRDHPIADGTARYDDVWGA